MAKQNKNVAQQKKVKKTPKKSIVKQKKTKKTKKTVQHNATIDKNHATYLEYINWYALPLPDKIKIGIKTETIFAKKHKVERSTLWRWRQKDDFSVLVNKIIKDWGRGKTSTVLAGLYKRTLRYGMAQDVKLWLQYFNNWSEKQIIEEIKQFNPDSLKTLLNELPKDEQKQYKKQLAGLLLRITQKERAENNKR